MSALTEWLNNSKYHGRKGSRTRRSAAPPAPRDGLTEQKILDAAHAVFVRSGTAGARTQEIAREAGVNSALLHYYFRTKARLAEAVFRRAAGQLLPAVIRILASDLELEDKVEQVVQTELQHLSKAPYLPGYILSELAHHPERAGSWSSAMSGWCRRKSAPRSSARSASRSTRACAPAACTRSRPNSSSSTSSPLCVFPFAARPMLMALLGFDQAGFDHVHRPAPQGAGAVFPEGPTPMKMRSPSRISSRWCSRCSRRRAARSRRRLQDDRSSSARCSRRPSTPIRALPASCSCWPRRASCGSGTSPRGACRRSVNVDGQAQYQSDVPTAPFTLPAAASRSSRRRRPPTTAALRRPAPLRRHPRRAGAPRARAARRAAGARPDDAVRPAAAGERGVLCGGGAAGARGRAGRHDRRSRDAAARNHRARVAKARRFRPTPPPSRPRCCSAGRMRGRSRPIVAPRSARLATLTGQSIGRRTRSRCPIWATRWRASAPRPAPARVPSTNSSRARATGWRASRMSRRRRRSRACRPTARSDTASPA